MPTNNNSTINNNPIKFLHIKVCDFHIEFKFIDNYNNIITHSFNSNIILSNMFPNLKYDGTQQQMYKDFLKNYKDEVEKRYQHEMNKCLEYEKIIDSIVN